MEMKFRKSIRGFHPQDVLDYLHSLNCKHQDETIQLKKENEELREELRALQEAYDNASQELKNLSASKEETENAAAAAAAGKEKMQKLAEVLKEDLSDADKVLTEVLQQLQ